MSLASTALLLASCSRPAPVDAPVRVVKAITVGASAYGSPQEYPGEVRARLESRLGFRIGVKLPKRPAELGQLVRAGQGRCWPSSTRRICAWLPTVPAPR